MLSLIKSGGLPLVAGLVILSGLTGTPEAQAGPNMGQCTQYVAAKLGLPQTYPNAKDWVSWLPNLPAPAGRFRQILTPQIGAVIVFQPGRHGVTDWRGHVGRVANVQPVPGGFRVTCRGANQTSDYRRWFVDIYTNVSDFNFTIPANGDGFASFWTR